jgi:hypothetical protein
VNDRPDQPRLAIDLGPPTGAGVGSSTKGSGDSDRSALNGDPQQDATLDGAIRPLIASVTMMLSWNEVRRRAAVFAREYRDESRERQAAISFWTDFFAIFDLKARRVASFEHQVKLLKTKIGYIDLFWPGVLLVEHKARGRDLDAAYTQALKYFDGLAEEELPRFVLVSDFARFRLYNLDEKTQQEFLLRELPEKVRLFGFMLGRSPKPAAEEEPVNLKAADLMARLHGALKDSNYSGHALEIFLVRILFCLFADDTGIFIPKDHLRSYLEERTHKDGSDLGRALGEVFQVLATDDNHNKRSKALDEDLAMLPYVNGQLFNERMDMPSFNTESRKILLQCFAFNWGSVSPAVFGSLFQNVMMSETPKKREELALLSQTDKEFARGTPCFAVPGRPGRLDERIASGPPRHRRGKLRNGQCPIGSAGYPRSGRCTLSPGADVGSGACLRRPAEPLRKSAPGQFLQLGTFRHNLAQSFVSYGRACEGRARRALHLGRKHPEGATASGS